MGLILLSDIRQGNPFRPPADFKRLEPISYGNSNAISHLKKVRKIRNSEKKNQKNQRPQMKTANQSSNDSS
jgi:hypothetical protein